MAEKRLTFSSISVQQFTEHYTRI